METANEPASVIACGAPAPEPPAPTVPTTALVLRDQAPTALVLRDEAPAAMTFWRGGRDSNPRPPA